MFYEEDWLMRQINMMARAIAKLACGGETSIRYDLHRQIKPGEVGGDLRSMLTALTAQGQFCKAEDLLFDSIHPDQPDDLKLGLDFYTNLNCLPDEVLAAGNFPREEVKSGLEDLMHFYGISLGENN
ncbi:MAG TPA: hypothetical protein DHW78_03395 [Ruminococcaceae bacterium]|jgi:hypothetical protein|nr:hypothetical protein [Oscillospiraceae bacterium]HCC03231.1 hypothetical protein [Oscillospiraceae bacterium]HCM23359.1 hypothetical protein [Oscillospiraceae bacterium]